MRNLWVILSRELKTYFNSPIAYIFVIVFVVLVCGLYMASFFLAGNADMRAFFSLLPIVLIVFVPAVSMRLWSEDKKIGTIELLLTFPMKSWQILLGKFFAAFLFLMIALAGTVTLPIIISILGRPDPGPIIGGYVGTLLLGAFFLSIGLFISGLCKDQIVAFILSVIGCFFFFFIGTDFFTTVIGGWLQRSAAFLQDYVGLTRHFEGLERGVIDIRALIYFVSMTALFLALNAIYLEGRLRPKAKAIFSGAVVLLAVAAAMVNVVAAGFRAGRFDLTEGRIFTVSDSAKSVLKGLKDKVHVKFYVTSKDKMPAMMKTLQQDVTDKLEEFRVASDNMLQYSVYDPSADAELAQKITDKGVRPFLAQTVDKDELSTKRLYSAIVISYAEKKDEIIPQVDSRNFNNLEYELISRLYRLTLSEKPAVAIYAPLEELDPQMKRMYMQMGRPAPAPRDDFGFLEEGLRREDFEITRVKLEKGNTFPEKLNCALIINPKELNERQKYEINRALVEGKNMLIAVQDHRFDYRPGTGENTISVMPEKVNPQINDLLENWGVTVDENFLMDESNATLRVPSERSLGGFIRVTVDTPVKVPTHIVVRDQDMNRNVSITNRLDQILYLWGTKLKISKDKLKELGLKDTVLMTSTEKSWTIPFHSTPLMSEDVVPPAEKYEGKQPLMAMITGQFPDAFKGKKRPDWPPPEVDPTNPRPPSNTEEEEPEKPLEPKPAKLIVVGCSQMFTDNFIGDGGNQLLTRNLVDALALGEELISIRSKQFTERSIKVTTAGQKLLYRFMATGLIPILFIGIGVIRYIVIRKGKERYLRNLATA
jgi:ABC-2 type transport system permease protein